MGIRRANKLPPLLLGLLVTVIATSQVARAAQIETLLMPGKVTQAHAKIEGECASCHDRSDRNRQAALCAGCHENIAEDLRTQQGFHGRLIGGERMQCRACHSEHQGRDADIVRFVPEQFDHSRTDFALQDMHAALPCGSCHAADKRFRDAPSGCHDCHRDDEPHAGKLGTDCASCHETSAWSRIRFDHGRTDFPLNGRHDGLACAACHLQNRYEGTPQRCVSCHAPDDPHRGSRGDDCGKCHTTAQWATRKFDHAGETGFALDGAHAQTACTGCHTSGRMQDPIPKDCHGCHKAQDAHAGRFGVECATCHDAIRWRQTHFDHAREAKFELLGAHAELDCHACHSAAVSKQKLARECVACHRGNDVHAGRLGAECESCHVPDGWRVDVAFDHDLTDFPLIGLHVAVPCEQCHLTPAYKDGPSDCYGCHRSADKHEGSLGPKCESCHSPNGWNLWEFDHESVTGFALSGSHSTLQCADCHRQPPSAAKLGRECVSCHANDDVHFGDFGRQCQRCHSTISFRQVRIR
jgi:hypothetical protein